MDQRPELHHQLVGLLAGHGTPHTATHLCHIRGSVHPSNNARRQFPLKLIAMGFVGSVVLRTLEFVHLFGFVL